MFFIINETFLSDEFTPREVCVAQSLISCVVFCWSLF